MVERKRAGVSEARLAVRQAEASFQARLDRGKAPAGWAVLGSMPGADIEALAFLVMMEAGKSARDDMKRLMADMKAIAERKAALRDAMARAAAGEPPPRKDLLGVVDADSFARAIVSLQVNALIAELEADRDRVSEISEMDSVRLQIFMDRVSKMMSTLSNLMKKLSDTQSSIVANLK